MKRTYPKHIAGIIDEAMERAGLTESLNGQKAAAAWIDVVGPAINRYTTRRYVSSGVLHVYLTSAPLKNELSFNRDRLISAINRVVGAEVISDVQFH
ncbi:MAG: DUF721 domain-containing protein [Duncaniella sp.]|uniref:DUF721 domain-containing protein n=1 Tax=Duncaniella sp. TaxID=2518496 RepID=UPI0023BBC51A|nr:DUF721 domain-containing protein [Duncaniella sp.]MDE5989054.1 DUF721 domain-containing protein [Duncaniella sp.]MDE6174760.1 DUF721 domain-containing protein [Duncaniella sp.]